MRFQRNVDKAMTDLRQFLGLQENAIPSSVGNATDGNLLTHTTMGNTIGQNEQLRVTLGFLSSSGEPPSNNVVAEPITMLLFGTGLVGAFLHRKIA